jgi:hypothetical protein
VNVVGLQKQPSEWVNPPSQHASFVGLAASVGSVGMDLPVG